MSFLPERLARLRPLFRRGRIPGIRTAKTTLAAVVSFSVARALNTSEAPVLAPLTALLVVQLTLYETVLSGLDRVGSVLAGVLVAVGVAEVVGLTWWSLGIVVALSLVLGRILRLGANLLEVPISAMIVLALGGSATLALGRVYETLIGAVVGVAANLAIAPPLYVQPAEDALAELAERMSTFLIGLADRLRQGWSRDAADRWLNRARELGAEVARADLTLSRAEDSARFNPRGHHARLAQPRLRIGLNGLEQVYVSLRSLCRALLDRTYFMPPGQEDAAYGDEVRRELADVLAATARAVDHVGEYAASALPADEALAAIDVALTDVDRGRDELAQMLQELIDPAVDAASWQQHGALLASLDRLRVEIRAVTRPPDAPWRPPPVAERQRQAVRAAVELPLERLRTYRERHADDASETPEPPPPPPPGPPPAPPPLPPLSPDVRRPPPPHRLG